MKQGLRKAASLSLYGDKEAEKREKAQRKKRREAAQRERHQACAARRGGKEELSFSDWEKDEKATREKLAKDRERASEAAAAARRDGRRRRSGGDDVRGRRRRGRLSEGLQDDGRRATDVILSRTRTPILLNCWPRTRRPSATAAAEVTDSDGSALRPGGHDLRGARHEDVVRGDAAGGAREAAAASGVSIKATSITKCSGEASLVVSRGSRARRIFEFAADIKWEAKLPAEAPPGPGARGLRGRCACRRSAHLSMTAPTPRTRARTRILSSLHQGPRPPRRDTSVRRRRGLPSSRSSATTPRRRSDDDGDVN